jgi:hypothetical protein
MLFFPKISTNYFISKRLRLHLRLLTTRKRKTSSTSHQARVPQKKIEPPYFRMNAFQSQPTQDLASMSHSTHARQALRGLRNMTRMTPRLRSSQQNVKHFLSGYEKFQNVFPKMSLTLTSNPSLRTSAPALQKRRIYQSHHHLC